MLENLTLSLWTCWQFFRNLSSYVEELCVEELPVWKALYFEMTANSVSVCVPLYSHEGVQHIIILRCCSYVRK